MLRGVSHINLDAKGRLAIPTRYRAKLKDCCDGQLVVTADKDRCLVMYPLPEWEDVERKLIRLSSLSKRAKALKRFMIGYVHECEMDAQGRVFLSESLREFASLERRIVLNGQLNKFEIWNELAWVDARDEWLNQGDGDEAEVLAELGDLSF